MTNRLRNTGLLESGPRVRSASLRIVIIKLNSRSLREAFRGPLCPPISQDFDITNAPRNLWPGRAKLPQKTFSALRLPLRRNTSRRGGRQCLGRPDVAENEGGLTTLATGPCNIFGHAF